MSEHTATPEPLDDAPPCDPHRERMALILAVQQLAEINAALQVTIRSAEAQLLQLEITHRNVFRMIKRAEHLLNPPPVYTPPPTQRPGYLRPAARNILRCLLQGEARTPQGIQAYTGLAGGTVRTHLPELHTLGLIQYQEGLITLTDAGRLKLDNPC